MVFSLWFPIMPQKEHNNILMFKETISKMEIRVDLLIAFHFIRFQHLQIHPHAFNIISVVDWVAVLEKRKYLSD